MVDSQLSDDMTSDGRSVLEIIEDTSSDQPSSNILESILLSRDINNSLSSSSLFLSAMKPTEKESESPALDASKQVSNPDNLSSKSVNLTCLIH